MPTRPPAPDAAPLRLVVADDSAFMRRILTDVLRARGADVIGQARDGDEALALCRRLRPDAMTLDLAMPGMDGIAVLRSLRAERLPVPVVVVSAFSPAHGARAVDALAEGALELVAKPAAGSAPERFFDELWQKVGLAAAAAATRRAPAMAASAAAPLRRVSGAGRRVVVVASSTGGPRALAELLPRLPERVGDGILVVQHMPAGFTASLAARLDRTCAFSVREAAGGERIERGVALIAPGGRHLRVAGAAGAGTVRLSDEPEVGGLRPRADLTIVDAARVLRERLLLVVLTGMGKDGLEGARAVRAAGGRVLAEAESTCTVYGMPRAVAEAGMADGVLPLHALHEAIVAEAGT